MHYTDLRDFIAQLERLGELKRISVPVDPRLEMTEICDRVLAAVRAHVGAAPQYDDLTLVLCGVT